MRENHTPRRRLYHQTRSARRAQYRLIELLIGEVVAAWVLTSGGEASASSLANDDRAARDGKPGLANIVFSAIQHRMHAFGRADV